MDYYAFSSLHTVDRPMDYPVAFSSLAVKTWKDFRLDVAILGSYFEKQDTKRWLLNTDNSYEFSCALQALLLTGKEPLLCANTTEGVLRHFKEEGAGCITGKGLAGSISISMILANSKLDTGFPIDTCSFFSRFTSLNSTEARLTLYTSGSTGSPKAFPKRLKELEIECLELWRIWKDIVSARKVYSTVNHHHIYGLLFSILLPLQAGLPFSDSILQYPESLEALGDPAPVLVCSPAFLKRVAEVSVSPGLFSSGLTVFSSGGVLPLETAQAVKNSLGCAPLEIYGSTETGGIAWRKSVEEELWKPFDRHNITIAENGQIRVRSPYITDPDGFLCGDLGRLCSDGRFALEGRVDSIVKIEEKRISLTEVEKRLGESPYVAQSCVIPLTGKRQYLGAAIVLSPAGNAFFRDATKREMNEWFREHLSAFLESTVIPKKWRFVGSLPRNSEDKLLRAEIEALFRKNRGVHVNSVLQSDSAVVVGLTVSADSLFFDGHFPEFPILPAVAQCDIALRLADEYFSTGLVMRGIPRVKFKQPIPPDVQLRLELKVKEEGKKVSFSYSDEFGKIQYSEGVFILGRGDDEL